MQNLDIVNLIPKKVLVSRLVFPLKVVHSSDHHWPQVMGSEEERRSKILRDYYELRRTHPELPAQLRDFQVEENCCTVHLKIFRWTYFVVPWRFEMSLCLPRLDPYYISCLRPCQHPRQRTPEGWEKLRHRWAVHNIVYVPDSSFRWWKLVAHWR